MNLFSVTVFYSLLMKAQLLRKKVIRPNPNVIRPNPKIILSKRKVILSNRKNIRSNGFSKMRIYTSKPIVAKFSQT